MESHRWVHLYDGKHKLRMEIRWFHKAVIPSAYCSGSERIPAIPSLSLRFGGMFFIGITIGRALNGFLAMKLSNTQMVRMGQVLMACAYVGSSLMPPLFGLIAGHITVSLLPVYLSAILVLMIVMHDGLIRKTAQKEAA